MDKIPDRAREEKVRKKVIDKKQQINEIIKEDLPKLAFSKEDIKKVLNDRTMIGKKENISYLKKMTGYPEETLEKVYKEWKADFLKVRR